MPDAFEYFHKNNEQYNCGDMRCSKCIPKCTYAPNFITSRSTYNWKYNAEKINYILRMRRTQLLQELKNPSQYYYMCKIYLELKVYLYKICPEFWCVFVVRIVNMHLLKEEGAFHELSVVFFHDVNNKYFSFLFNSVLEKIKCNNNSKICTNMRSWSRFISIAI